MNNQDKLNFIKQFNIIGELGENNVEDELNNSEDRTTIAEAFEDFYDEIQEYVNPDDIAIPVIYDLTEDKSEYERMLVELDEKSKVIYTSEDCELIIKEHPIVGRYLDIDCGNPGLVFLFNK